MSSEAIKIVVIDDHALFRAGLIDLLDQMPDLQVVGEAGNGKEGLGAIAATQPEVVLLDVSTPILDGADAVVEIREISECKILMLTVSKRQEELTSAIRAGADGYLLKNARPEELRRNIRWVVSKNRE